MRDVRQHHIITQQHRTYAHRRASRNTFVDDDADVQKRMIIHEQVNASLILNIIFDDRLDVCGSVSLVVCSAVLCYDNQLTFIDIFVRVGHQYFYFF